MPPLSTDSMLYSNGASVESVEQPCRTEPLVLVYDALSTIRGRLQHRMCQELAPSACRSSINRHRRLVRQLHAGS
jgi:hypothetical protein